MNDLHLSNLPWSPDQRRLLGGWRDILDDLRVLCKSLDALPDDCACGDGVSHLNGSCICCNAPHDNRIPICADCSALLGTLRPLIDTLTVDTIRFFPVVEILLGSPELGPVRAEGQNVEHHIAAVTNMFRRLALEAGEFQDGCRASHLRVLKGTATALLNESRHLDERLEQAP